MLINDIHALVLQRLNSDSSDYDATKLMTYVNDGIFFVNNTRISANDPETIKQMTITGTITKPTDFFAFVPAKSAYPLIAIGTTISLAVGAPPSVAFKYSTKCPAITSVNDTFPLPDEFAGFVSRHIEILLKMDNSMTMAEDIGVLGTDISAFIKAKGG